MRADDSGSQMQKPMGDTHSTGTQGQPVAKGSESSMRSQRIKIGIRPPAESRWRVHSRRDLASAEPLLERPEIAVGARIDQGTDANGSRGNC